MRTYSKKTAVDGTPYKKPPISKKEYMTREATEWDLRIDLKNGITLESIIERIKPDLSGLLYVMVGGIEDPDATSCVGASIEDHVHVAIVFVNKVNRQRALRVIREHKVCDEYATPRNPNYTYAGWLAHHSKDAFKKDPTSPNIAFEYGTLPMDNLDEATCWKVVKILKKFGTKDIKARFSMYYDHIDKYKSERNIEVHEV